MNNGLFFLISFDTVSGGSGVRVSGQESGMTAFNCPCVWLTKGVTPRSAAREDHATLRSRRRRTANDSGFFIAKALSRQV
jgi:hypothetical protein